MAVMVCRAGTSRNRATARNTLCQLSQRPRGKIAFALRPALSRQTWHVSRSNSLTEAAPALDADLRTFAVRAPADGQPLKLGPGFPPLVSAYVLFASDGTVLERLESSRR